MISRATAFLFLCVASLGGCKHQIKISDGGFENERYGYAVPNLPQGGLMGDNWLLDNFQSSSRKGARKPKRGPDYEIKLALDTNGDGAMNSNVKYPTYDLKFRHRTNRGVIWIRSLPLSQHTRQTEARVLLRGYIQSMSGAGLIVTQIGQADAFEYSTKTLFSEPAVVGGLPAQQAVVEIANAQELKLSPDSRWLRAELVIIKTPFEFTKGRANFPVVLIAGYSNLAEDFAQGRAEFHELLSRFRLGRIYSPERTTERNAIAGWVMECTPNTHEVDLRLQFQDDRIKKVRGTVTKNEETCLNNALHGASAQHLERRESFIRVTGAGTQLRSTPLDGVAPTRAAVPEIAPPSETPPAAPTAQPGTPAAPVAAPSPAPEGSAPVQDAPPAAAPSTETPATPAIPATPATPAAPTN